MVESFFVVDVIEMTWPMLGVLAKRPQVAGSPAAQLAAAAKCAAYANSGAAAKSAPMLMAETQLPKKLFGLNMRRGRRLAGNMSQEALGALLGYDRRIINRWENGGREPQGPTRLRIADALGQPLDFFYDDSPLEDDQ